MGTTFSPLSLGTVGLGVPGQPSHGPLVSQPPTALGGPDTAPARRAIIIGNSWPGR